MREAVGIEVFLVAKGHRLERKDRFACLVHRFDCFLVACRGSRGAKMTIRIYDHGYAAWNGCPTNTGDKCGRVSSDRADANCVGFVRNTTVTDFDIVIAVQTETGSKA